MDKCAGGAFEKLIKKQTAGGGKARILPLRGKSGSYGKKNAAQALPIPRAGPSVSLPGTLYVNRKVVVDGRHTDGSVDDVVVVLAAALPDLPGPKKHVVVGGEWVARQRDVGLWRKHGFKICKFHTKHLFVIQ